MKSLLPALLLLCVMPAAAQFIYNPLPLKQGDFRKIFALGITKCLVYRQAGSNDKALYQEAEYGAQGLIAGLYEKGFNDAGDTINKNELIYKFDGKGRLVHTTYTDKEEGGGTDVPSLYTYDAAGRLTRRVTAEIDPPTYNYKYDAAGRLKEVYVTQRMPQYDATGESHGKAADFPAHRCTYRYDAKARLAEEWEYNLRDGSREPAYKRKWAYDNAGRIVMLQCLSGAGNEISKEIYTYNADGLLASCITNENEEAVRYTYEYCKGCTQSWMR